MYKFYHVLGFYSFSLRSRTLCSIEKKPFIEFSRTIRGRRKPRTMSNRPESSDGLNMGRINSLIKARKNSKTMIKKSWML